MRATSEHREFAWYYPSHYNLPVSGSLLRVRTRNRMSFGPSPRRSDNRGNTAAVRHCSARFVGRATAQDRRAFLCGWVPGDLAAHCSVQCSRYRGPALSKHSRGLARRSHSDTGLPLPFRHRMAASSSWQLTAQNELEAWVVDRWAPARRPPCNLVRDTPFYAGTVTLPSDRNYYFSVGAGQLRISFSGPHQ